MYLLLLILILILIMVRTGCLFILNFREPTVLGVGKGRRRCVVCTTAICRASSSCLSQARSERGRLNGFLLEPIRLNERIIAVQRQLAVSMRILLVVHSPNATLYRRRGLCLPLLFIVKQKRKNIQIPLVYYNKKKSQINREKTNRGEKSQCLR